MSDDNTAGQEVTASRNYYRRLAEELREADTPQARHQAILDRHGKRCASRMSRMINISSVVFRNFTRRLQASTSPGAIGIGEYANGPPVLAAAIRRD